MARSYTGVARLTLEDGRDLGEVNVQIYDLGMRGWEGTMWSPARHIFDQLAYRDMLTCVLRMPGGRHGRIIIQRASVASGRTLSFVGDGDSPLEAPGDRKDRRR